ncbi:MAG: hypothetical protein ABIS67_03120 [Candidatus Eisenbacteria bacterium]
MRGHLLLVFVAPIAALLLSSVALAQWMPNGVPLSGVVAGDINLIVPDGAGGAYVAWRNTRNSSDVYLQRVTGGGFIAPGWPVSGLPLATTSDPEELMDLEPDGQGGAIVIWLTGFYDQDFNVEVDNVVQRIQADGTPVAGWPASGVRILAPRRQDPAVLASDGTGGVYIVWEDDRDYLSNFTLDVYALHLLADGSVAPDWPTDGVPVAVGPFTIGSPLVVPDNQGGAFFLWSDNRRGPGTADVFGSRVRSDATLADGWLTNGNFLAPEPLRAACSDGAGGVFLLTTEFDPVYTLELRYFLRRIASDGTPAPGWTAAGIILCDAPGHRSGSKLAPDGRGGVLATWYDSRGGAEIYLIRILPNGAIAPGWMEDGTRISDPSNTRFEFDPHLVDDGAGGAFVVWNQDGPSVVHHLTETGQPAPGWPAYGLPIAASSSQLGPKIATDGEGGAIVAWSEGCCGRNGIWAQRYVAGGIVAVQLSLVSAVAEADRVTLEWFAAGGVGLVATVQRRSESADWRTLTTLTTDGTGHLRYEDRDVKPGGRYAYRLAYRDEGIERFTGESWIEVPAVLELRLEGFRPNPAVGSPIVSFTLPRVAPGRIELFDLAGRRVAERDLAAQPAGRHVLRIAEEAALPPAAYVIRLTHAGRTISSRGVVVR